MYELDPRTERIYQCALKVIKQNNSYWNDDDAEDLILKAIRDEEIRIKKFLVQFCQLSFKQRKSIWERIVKNLVKYLPRKKNRKRLEKEFKVSISNCLMQDYCD